MRVLVAGGTMRSLVRFRGTLLARMVELGHEVHTCAGEHDPSFADKLSALGVAHHDCPSLERSGTNPLSDARYARELRALVRELRPTLVLAYTLKPSIFASLAARAADARSACMITGVGSVFGEHGSPRALAMRLAVRRLLRTSLSRSEAVFFQNPDDRDEFVAHHLVDAERSAVLPGSGVDLDAFAAAPVPEGPPVFLLVARLFAEKGIREFVEAARELRAREPNARFRLLGPLEPGGRGIPRAELEAWTRDGVEYLGETDDVRPYLRDATVFVLPSYYREGQPRAILEALAVGRPIVTTNSPGCRETVEEGTNGFLVPPRDSRALARAMARFLDDPTLATRLGAASRRLAEARYDAHRVDAMILARLGLATQKSAQKAASNVARQRTIALYFPWVREMTGAPRSALNLLLGLDPERWRPLLITDAENALGAAVAAAGHDVEILPLPPRLALRDREALRLGWSERLSAAQDLARHQRELAALLTRQEVELVWARNAKCVLFAARAARRARAAYVWDVGLEDPSRGLSYLLHEWALRQADLIVTQSPSRAERVFGKRRARAVAHKLACLEPGVDPTRARAIEDAARTRPATGPLLLSVGTLHPRKNQRLLLEAALPLLSQYRGTGLRFAGSAPQADYARELARLPAAHGVADCVEFLGWRDDVPELMGQSHVLVLSSNNEGVPQVVREAMLSGLAIVSSTVGGVPDLLEHGKTALLVPPGDAVALRAALVELFDSPGRVAELGAAARAEALRRFSHEAWQRRYDERLWELAQDRERRASVDRRRFPGAD